MKLILGGEKDMCVHGSLGKGGSKNSPAPSPYKRGGLGWGLFLALRQLKHNFELDIGDSLTTQLEMPLSIISTVVASDNLPLLVRK